MQPNGASTGAGGSAIIANQGSAEFLSAAWHTAVVLASTRMQLVEAQLRWRCKGDQDQDLKGVTNIPASALRKSRLCTRQSSGSPGLTLVPSPTSHSSFRAPGIAGSQ